MASSRIFVRNLPPNLTEDEFKKHFSKLSTPTDTRFFNARRIGYVGYKTPEDAAKAVKYFNKSFIRMTKIAVDLARPVGLRGGVKQAAALTKEQANDDSLSSKRKSQKDTTSKSSSTAPHNERVRIVIDETSKKRKRDSATEQDADPKLKEFLKVMQPPKKSKTWRDEAVDKTSAKAPEALQEMPDATADSDGEYQSLARPKQKRTEKTTASVEEAQESSDDDINAGEAADDLPEVTEEPQVAQSDADWLRSRTSRLLGLLHEEEEEQYLPTRADDADAESSQPQSPEDDSPQAAKDGKATSPEPDTIDQPAPIADADEEAIQKSKRLFLRNLPYGVNEDDLREAFGAFGHLEEVSKIFQAPFSPFNDDSR